MEGIGANLNKVRQQAASRNKAKVPARTIQPSITIPPSVTQEQPFIANAAMFMEPNETTSTISTPQELRKALTPMASVPIDRTNIQQAEPEDPESERFLASLIAQGITGLGAGLMGGSSQDILRSTGIFDRMRESDINRQDRLRQADLLRTERLGEKQERLAEIKKREEQAKSLTDPNSEESKRDRLLYEKVLKTKIPEEVTAFDLRNRPEIVRSLMAQAEQSRLAAMPRDGVGAVKEEKRKEPTEAERLSLGFAKRTESSDKVLNDLENKFINKEGGFSPSSEFPFAPERLKSESRKNYEAAQKDFVGAILRKESGAAISDEEFKRESEKFFPLPGDTPANIAYKQLLRKQAINNLKTSANVRYVRDNQTGETIEIDPFGNILRRYK